ncbi:hypothetical protein LGN17_28610 [Burkholderia sp. AU30280]|uniref:hypothetical protein n=1 Tax=Burkholderia sp. AU30280 TaxID=2879628 RepID=UPI001CF26A6A|nr:hypothetical protein [Burkholderia sp. AU30280]MCA8276452.1 hypothetical protein [Burkholderia sp. AU30280]
MLARFMDWPTILGLKKSYRLGATKKISRTGSFDGKRRKTPPTGRFSSVAIPAGPVTGVGVTMTTSGMQGNTSREPAIMKGDGPHRSPISAIETLHCRFAEKVASDRSKPYNTRKINHLRTDQDPVNK